MRLDRWCFFGRPRSLGERGEAAAARFLKKRGYHIVARSYRTALGELDLVAVDLVAALIDLFVAAVDLATVDLVAALIDLFVAAVDLDDDRGPALVFVEVKTRTGYHTGYPEEAVDRRKQHKLAQLALHYRATNNVDRYPARFDVVAVVWPEKRNRPEIVHYRDAFDCAIDDVVD